MVDNSNSRLLTNKASRGDCTPITGGKPVKKGTGIEICRDVSSCPNAYDYWFEIRYLDGSKYKSDYWTLADKINYNSLTYRQVNDGILQGKVDPHGNKFFFWSHNRFLITGSESTDLAFAANPDAVLNINLAGGDDVAIGSRGADTIRGGSGNDFIDGNWSNDSLFGDSGCDTLAGGNGNDTLNGGGDVDVLIGGKGNDVLTGGRDGDYFNFFRADFDKKYCDTITDFCRPKDRINLCGIDGYHIEKVGCNSIITLIDNHREIGTIVIQNNTDINLINSHIHKL